MSLALASPRFAASLVALTSIVASPAAPAQCMLETVKLLASDGEEGDWFGHSVTVNGTTIVVGASRQDSGPVDSGATYVYERDLGGTGMWGERAKLVASDASTLDVFGRSVSLSGDTLVVGARSASGVASRTGAAYVFERDAGGVDAWGEVAKLVALDGENGDAFGHVVAVAGNTIVVGAMRDDVNGRDSGSAYVFERNLGGPGHWGQIAKIAPGGGAAGDSFGRTVGITTNTIVIGAPFDDDGGSDTGSAYVFERDQGGANAWGQRSKLTTIDVTTDSWFGRSVAIWEDSVVIGAHWDAAGVDGAAFIFDRDNGGVNNWGEAQKLVPEGGVAGWLRVAIETDTIAVGTPRDVSGSHMGGEPVPGATYVFARAAGIWAEVAKLAATDNEGGNELGYSVSVSGSTIVAGARWDDVGEALDRGSAYIYDGVLDGFEVYCTAGISASGCRATISASGTPSASATSGFELSVSNVEGAKDGLFFFSTNGRQGNSWGNGSSYQCVVPPVLRAGAIVGTGSPGTCEGVVTQDMNSLWCSTCPKPTKNPGFGAVVQAEFWYRDPLNTSNRTTSLSDAIEFTVCP